MNLLADLLQGKHWSLSWSVLAMLAVDRRIILKSRQWLARVGGPLLNWVCSRKVWLTYEFTKD